MEIKEKSLYNRGRVPGLRRLGGGGEAKSPVSGLGGGRSQSESTNVMNRPREKEGGGGDMDALGSLFPASHNSKKGG